MADTRQDILNYLHEKGAADVNGLAGALGLSPVTIHYHINVLQRDGLLETKAVRQGVGRPRNVFTLRAAAFETFPQGYHRLSDRLLEILKSRMTETDIQALFEGIGAEIAAEHAANLQGKTLEQKIDLLVGLLGEEGFMSRLEKIGTDHFVLTQVNCPYQYVATRHPEVCELDLQLMNSALGTAVKREACVANGDSVCTFHIKSQPIQLQA
ncbi:MAG: helix-turn-helix domain-containing protein [Chloroflexi bacterium]|nr:helix-turn-helix domain-containing protein [Chloroflexota bacterium]